MISSPPKYQHNFIDINKEYLSNLKGSLDEKTAKLTLAKFLKQNIGFTMEILTGGEVKLTSHQELAVKAIINRNFSMCIWGRGSAKSYCGAIAAILLSIFEPGTTIVVCAPNFRTSRVIFEYIEKIVENKKSTLLHDIFGYKSRKNDVYSWEITNGSSKGYIKVLPLNGDKLRGIRSNSLILDEFRLLSEDIIKNVLMPFLIVPSDIKNRIKIREKENALIKSGKMKEEDRTKFKNKARMIALSSAGYKFENIYLKFKEWTDKIENPKDDDDATYFVSQLSYKAVPEYLWDMAILNEAITSQGEFSPSFQMEYCAQFPDGSDGYFSAKKMHELSIDLGKSPTMMIKGNPNRKYILSIDPNMSNSPKGDLFAMSVGEIQDNNTIMLVHSYGVAGVPLKDHIKYFLYLMKSFNIVMICTDNADCKFVDSVNESEIAKRYNVKVNFIDYDNSYEGQDYIKMLGEARKQYNLSDNKICFKKIFNQDSIRKMNEQLQTFINTKKIWFAAPITPNDDEYEAAYKAETPIIFDDIENPEEKNNKVIDFISSQDDNVHATKRQTALIEVKSTPNGGLTFDLPQNLRRDNTVNRTRRDLYTALMLMIEGFQAYTNLMKEPEKQIMKSFIPRLVGQSTL